MSPAGDDPKSKAMPGAVVLRDVNPSDLSAFFAYQIDPVANRMAAFTPRDWDAFTVHWEKILADATSTKRTILFGGRVAGNVVSWGPPTERLVGYWIAREYWNRGIASAALALFLNAVPDRPLFAHVAKHNRGSLRVLEKCGFTVVRSDTVPWEGQEIEEIVLVLGGNATPPSPPSSAT